MIVRDGMSRRRFVKDAAAAGAAALGLSSRRPLRAQAAGPIGANERVTFATIGVGGMGSGHLGALNTLKNEGLVDIVAACDVFRPRAEGAAQRVGGQAYTDYREVLERDDLDAVSIATPDHWHAKITVDAADAGKDIYCEKPMTHWKSIAEPQAVVEAVARNKRVMQVGTQGMSDSVWEQASELVKAGKLGDLISAQASDMRNGYIGVYDPTRKDDNIKPGENLDWDMWLGWRFGLAPKRPFDPGRFLSFRVFWEYSGGVGTDFFPHILTPLVRSMNLDFPRRTVGSGGLYHYHDGREVPDIYNLVIEYPQGPSVYLLGGVASDNGIPMVIRGYEATMSFGGPGIVIDPQPTVKDRQREEVARTRGSSLEEHFRDLVNCIKTRQKPRSNELLGYRVMTALQMGIQSYRRTSVGVFDEATETIRIV